MILETVFYCIDHNEPQRMAWDETAHGHKCPMCGKTTTAEPDSMIDEALLAQINDKGIYAVEVELR